MIDTNLRNLKRSETGVFSVLRKSDAQLPLICNHCGARETCTMHASMRAAHEKGFALTLEGCKHFAIPIHFRDSRGLKHSRFNTVRMGVAWERRLKPGDPVTLLSAAGEVLGLVKVVSATLVTKADIGPYAQRNHMLIDEALSPELSLIHI